MCESVFEEVKKYLGLEPSASSRSHGWRELQRDGGEERAEEKFLMREQKKSVNQIQI